MALKPCPFCGGEAQLEWPYEGGAYLRHECDFVTSCWFETEADALEVWNTRAERTGRIKVDAETGCFLTCSECGAIQPEDYTVYHCWNCGAKVVE